MIDLSFVSIPILVTINAYALLWIALSLSHLLLKAPESHGLNGSAYSVTAVVPAHNEENVIEGILSDLAGQSYPFLDVIVVCHNCVDDTFRLASEFASHSAKPIKVLDFHSVESGKGLALNEALRHAKTDLIAYFDADARLECDWVEKSVGWIVSRYDAAQSRIRALDRFSKP